MFLGESCSGLSILCGYLAGRTGRKRNLSQPEVQNLGMATLGDENVGGLDVSVDDASSVSGVERVGNLDGEL
jgi:hypothetical protein